MKKTGAKPKFIMTYVCQKCGLEFSMTEFNRPVCLHCGSNHDFELVQRMEIGKDDKWGDIKVSSERIVQVLKGIYRSREKFGKEFSEDYFLNMMKRAQELRKVVYSLSEKESDLKSEK